MAAAKAQLPADWQETIVDAAPSSLFPQSESALITLTLLAGPEGDVSVEYALTDGSISLNEVAKDSDLSIQLAWNDAAAVLEGNAEPSVLFMQGKLKSTGSNALLLRMLKASTTPSFKEWRASIH